MNKNENENEYEYENGKDVTEGDKECGSMT